MLKLIDGLPANVVAIEASGKVEAENYRTVLDPAAAAAMWEDTKLGFHDLSAWERIAVVTDYGALADAIRVFGWLIPGEVRTYPTAQLADAKAWVSESYSSADQLASRATLAHPRLKESTPHVC